MAEVNTQIYQPLQAPQQQQLGPLQVLQMIGQLNSNRLFEQEYNSRQAIGEDYKNSIDPVTKQIDPVKLRQLLPTNGGFHAGEAVQQGITNESLAADRDAKYQQTGRQIIGELSTNPIITPEHLAKAKVRMSGAGLPSGVIDQFFSTAPKGDSKKSQSDLKDWAVTNSNLARGPDAAATLTPGNVDQNTNVRPLKPAGQVQREAVQGGGINPSLPEGVGASYAEGQKSLVEDQKSGARTLANLRNLDIALPLAEKLNHAEFGPGSPEWAKWRGAAITAGLVSPNANDPVTVRQELNKYLLKYATQAQNAGRSDQALGAAVGSNPNLDLTQPANLGLIKNQFGLDKMDAAVSKIFKTEHPGQAEASGYNQYRSDYYDRFDRRVFSYDKLTPEERRDLVQSLGGKNSPAYKKFEKTYETAKLARVIVPEKQ